MKRHVWWACITAAALAWAGGCNSDGNVLSRLANGGNDAVGNGGGGNDGSAGDHPSGGGPPSSGSDRPPPAGGGMTTGPPEPVFCPDPNAPMCECEPGQFCVCEPTPADQCLIGCGLGACTLECMPFADCNFDCEGGCEANCQPDSNCVLFCGDNCSLTCLSGSTCMLWSWNGPSSMYCEQGAVCDCQQGCSCFGPGCP